VKTEERIKIQNRKDEATGKRRKLQVNQAGKGRDKQRGEGGRRGIKAYCDEPEMVPLFSPRWRFVGSNFELCLEFDSSLSASPFLEHVSVFWNSPEWVPNCWLTSVCLC